MTTRLAAVLLALVMLDMLDMLDMFCMPGMSVMSVMSTSPARADEPGQADLDAAIDAKLAADDLDDYGTVLDHCKAAVKKGLDEESRKFADDLYTGTLIDRAGMVVEAIFDSPRPDPQWPRMRTYALRDLNEAIDRDPNLGAAQLMLARLESLPGGNRQRAVAAAEKAIELGGEDRLQIAQAHVILGNLEEDDKAKRASNYDKAAELAPRDADVRRTRGLFHLLNDDFEKARADLEVAIERSPMMLRSSKPSACRF